MELRDKLMEDADPVGQFLSESTAADETARIKRSDLHKVFQLWCEEEGGPKWSGRAVNNAMREKGYSTVKVGDVFWAGLRWHPDAFDRVSRAIGSRPKNAPPSPPAPPF